MVMRVTQYGEPILREVGQEVTEFGKPLEKLARDMLETMVAHEGTGLAAQQVGLPLRFFVLDISWHEDLNTMRVLLDGKPTPPVLLMPLAMANAEVELIGGEPVIAEEGCLSIPDLRGPVPRSHGIRVRYQDLQGATHHLEAEGWFARVIQHEFDHNQGILYVDRMEKWALRRLESKLKSLERRTRRRERLPTAG
jgi:peptide deformylase